MSDILSRMNFNLSNEEKEAMMRYLKNCMKKPTPLTTIKDVEYIKLPDSVYVIVNELGEIDNVYYNENKANNYCKMLNNSSIANSYFVEKHGISDAEEEVIDV
jgi:hypothetical protein